MALPEIGIDTATVTLPGGVKLDIRGLTFDEAATMRGERANPLCIAYATGSTEEEAAEWLGNIPAGVGQALVDAILEISCVGEEARFQD